MAYKTLRLYPGERVFSGSLLALAYMMVRHRGKMLRSRAAMQVYQSARSALELIPERFYENKDTLIQELRSRMKRTIDDMKQSIRRALGEEAEEYVEKRERDIDYYASTVENMIERVYSYTDPQEVGLEETKRRVVDTMRFLETFRREHMQRERTMYNAKIESLRAVIEGRQFEVIRNIATSELRFLISRAVSR
jgi:DNA replication protein DnaD